MRRSILICEKCLLISNNCEVDLDLNMSLIFVPRNMDICFFFKKKAVFKIGLGRFKVEIIRLGNVYKNDETLLSTPEMLKETKVNMHDLE